MEHVLVVNLNISGSLEWSGPENSKGQARRVSRLLCSVYSCNMPVGVDNFLCFVFVTASERARKLEIPLAPHQSIAMNSRGRSFLNICLSPVHQPASHGVKPEMWPSSIAVPYYFIQLATWVLGFRARNRPTLLFLENVFHPMLLDRLRRRGEAPCRLCSRTVCRSIQRLSSSW